jgi:thiamine-phosphate pyrophosphorylase
MCLVTDRRRLSPGAPFDAARNRLVEQAAWAVKSSIDLLQVRERDLPAIDLASLTDAILGSSRGSGTRIVVNDRLDVAIACGADGVHLRGDSMSAEAARRIAPSGFLIGRSVHDVAGARAAGPVDYLIAGTVFPTAGKAGDAPLLGLDGLADVVQAAGVPVLAIGGIDADKLDEVAATGAAGVAGIGFFIDWFEGYERSI